MFSRPKVRENARAHSLMSFPFRPKIGRINNLQKAVHFLKGLKGATPDPRKNQWVAKVLSTHTCHH